MIGGNRIAKFWPNERACTSRVAHPVAVWLRLVAGCGCLLAMLVRGLPAAPPFDLHARVAATASGGTLEVPPGIYRGPLRIEKPIRLVGQPGAIIDSGGKGDGILISAPDVTLRGFTIRHTGNQLDEENSGIIVSAPRATIEGNTLEEVLFGIYLKQSADSTVRDNQISGMPLDQARRGDGLRLWYSNNCLVEGNTLIDSRDAVVWFSRNVVVRNNTVHHGRYGLHFMYSFDNTVTGNRLTDNSVGVYLMYSRNAVLKGNLLADNRGPSGYGIGLKDMDDLVAEGNQCISNRVGIYLDTSPSAIDSYGHFTRNVVAFNDVGLAFLPSVERNIFTDNTFLENIEQVAVLGSGQLRGNQFTVTGRGNFWSDYNGYDSLGRGIGELPYRPQNLFEDLMDRHPRLRLFLFSPAQQTVDLAARAFPLLRPGPKITDDAPLMQFPTMGNAELHMWDHRMAGLAGGLLVLAIAVMAVGARHEAAPQTTAASQPQPTDTHASPTATGAAPPVPQKEACGVASLPQAAEMIVVSDLVKRFRQTPAVDHLSFRVPAGQVLALWGLNGAGKTTVIKCLLGLLRHDGDITVGGCELRRHGKQVRQMIGYVPQEPGFHADLVARDALRFYARLKGVSAARVGEVLHEVGLRPHANKTVAALSGGMRKRLALASALLADPPLLVLDEATANLDTAARHALLDLVQEQARRGKTVLFTSHRMGDVRTLADRVVALRAGKLIFDGAPAEFAIRHSPTVHLLLSVPADRLDEAAALLTSHGLLTAPAGAAVRVVAPAGEKALPVRLLAEGGITVSDFQLELDDLEGAE